MNLHDPLLRPAGRKCATPITLPGPDHVAILMGTYNGAKWLPDQLQSLLSQTHRDWSLLVGDDGSHDASADILHRFSTANPDKTVRFFHGPSRGFQANFLGLLRHVPASARYVAFCDQDDVWSDDKLSMAISGLADLPTSVPGLYGGRTEVTDTHMNTLGLSPNFRRAPSFQNALVQSLAGGNTLVFNRATLDLLRAAFDPDRLPVSHDWWTYQVVSGAGGTVMFDDTPHVRYRQHGGNQVGAGLGASARASRIKRLLRGDFATYTDRNLRSLQVAKQKFTAKNQSCLELLADGRRAGLLTRLGKLRKSGVYRQTALGNCALWAAIALGKI